MPIDANNFAVKHCGDWMSLLFSVQVCESFSEWFYKADWNQRDKKKTVIWGLLIERSLNKIKVTHVWWNRGW